MERNTLTIPSTMPFPEIVRLLVVAGIHGAPVVDEQGAIIGMVSAMDLLRASDQAHDDERDEGEGNDPLEQLSIATALELASPEPIWVAPEAPAGDVARLMHREGIHRVLVGADGRLEGILTAFDLLRAVS
jgi:CBS domain-containing protein